MRAWTQDEDEHLIGAGFLPHGVTPSEGRERMAWLCATKPYFVEVILMNGIPDAKDKPDDEEDTV